MPLTSARFKPVMQKRSLSVTETETWMNHRRNFIAAAGTGVLTAPFTSLAQSQKKYGAWDFFGGG